MFEHLSHNPEYATPKSKIIQIPEIFNVHIHSPGLDDCRQLRRVGRHKHERHNGETHQNQFASQGSPDAVLEPVGLHQRSGCHEKLIKETSEEIARRVTATQQQQQRGNQEQQVSLFFVLIL